MKKTLVMAILFMGLLLAFTACEENNYDSYPPTWKGFTVTPSIVKVGEGFQVTAVQKEKGHLLNATDYQWLLVVYKANNERDTVSKYSQHTNYDGISNADPVATLRIPADALPSNPNVKYRVHFQATYNYSGRGITIASGDNYDSQSYSGSIHTTSGALSGKAEGSVDVTVIQ